MKKLHYLLLALSILSTSVKADVAASFDELSNLASPGQNTEQVNAQALKLTCYFTDRLRLTQDQAAQVRSAILQQLVQQQVVISTAQEQQAYNDTMKRILTPEQYAKFERLEGRYPVANLSQDTSIQVAQK